MQRLYCLIFISFVFLGCGKTNQFKTATAVASDESDKMEYIVDSGLLTIQAFLDDQELNSIDLGSANISAQTGLTCAEDRFEACSSSGTQNISYSSCKFPDNSVQTGEWLLTFTGTGASQCSFPLPVSSSVTRTISSTLVRVFSSGEAIFTTSSDHTNFLNTTVGGGLALTRTAVSADPLSLQILGLQRNAYSRNGKIIFDHSLKSSTNLNYQGNLSDGTRLLSSGTLVVNHNLNRYTTTQVYTNVAWTDAQCCHPVSGKISVTSVPESGATTTFDVKFLNPCGSAQIYSPNEAGDSDPETYLLSKCE